MRRSVILRSDGSASQLELTVARLNALLEVELEGQRISAADVRADGPDVAVEFETDDPQIEAEIVSLLVSAGHFSETASSLTLMPQVAPSDLYRTAVEEYRFQATHNWSRTQYLLALNAGILIAAVGTAVVVPWLPAVIFGLGAFTSLATINVVKVQHNYYRSARDRMRVVEGRTHVDQEALITTTTSLGGRDRWFSVNQVISGVLVAMAIANVIGVILTLARP